MILGKLHVHSGPNSLLCKVDWILLDKPHQIAKIRSFLTYRLDILYIQPTAHLIGLLVRELNEFVGEHHLEQCLGRVSAARCKPCLCRVTGSLPKATSNSRMQDSMAGGWRDHSLQRQGFSPSSEGRLLLTIFTQASSCLGP